MQYQVAIDKQHQPFFHFVCEQSNSYGIKNQVPQVQSWILTKPFIFIENIKFTGYPALRENYIIFYAFLRVVHGLFMGFLRLRFGIRFFYGMEPGFTSFCIKSNILCKKLQDNFQQELRNSCNSLCSFKAWNWEPKL